MKDIGTKELTTGRLRLRRFAPDDAEAMFANWTNDAEVTRWMRWEPHGNVAVTREVLAEWVSAYQRDDTYHWAIERREDGMLMGSIGILPADQERYTGYRQPGYCIGRAFWGRGYTSEALRAVVRYYTEGTGSDKLYCCHALGNPASGRVMEKAGFRYAHPCTYFKPDGTAIEAKLYLWSRAALAEEEGLHDTKG